MYKNVNPYFVLKLLMLFGKNFVRKNFLERMVEFNGILTKRCVFDKKVAKFIFYNPKSSFTPIRPHKA